MIEVVLVDDEVLALKNLNFVLSQFEEDIVVLDMLSNPLEALVRIGALKPHVVFLDIEMPGLNGFNVAEEILKIEPDILIVFITAYDEYAVKAFEVNAIDYILKPVTVERMKGTIGRIKDRYRERQSSKDYGKALNKAADMLEIKLDKVVGWQYDKIYLINVADILYITITDEEAVMVTETSTYKAKGTLNNWEERLANRGFFRCHKGYLVNLNKVSVINPMFKNTYTIKLHNCNLDIPLSRRYAIKLKDMLKL